MSIDECHNTVDALFNKYKDDDYMKQRIINHISKYLPNTLSHESRTHKQRIIRHNTLTQQQQTFIHVFLNKNKYFYLPSTNYFYEYNGTNYTIIQDDYIIHNLLTSISKERILFDWKYKTKINIIKQIKDRCLFGSIPETETIQNILGILCPFMFPNKTLAKYFLTIIGDNILKKNNNLLFLINPPSKKILSVLDNISSETIGHTNITNNFLTKYHENHSYDKFRLLKMNENISLDVWKNILRYNGLDLLCLATHYSNRYINSDNFIEHNNDDIKSHVYYLKDNSYDKIIDDFCATYIINSGSTNQNIKLEWKNLHFIWKQYLFNLSLPNFIYSNTLKTLLIDRFDFDLTTDTFNNITSKFLPIHSDFIKFWENTITNDNNKVYTELEVDEIVSLFKFWSKQPDIKLMTNGNINEDTVIKILSHFYPNIKIIEDKYIPNIFCCLWDKDDEIYKSLEYVKTEIKGDNCITLISFDELYNYYSKYCNLNSQKYIVNKRYYEKFLRCNFASYINEDNFIQITDFMKM